MKMIFLVAGKTNKHTKQTTTTDKLVTCTQKRRRARRIVIGNSTTDRRECPICLFTSGRSGLTVPQRAESMRLCRAPLTSLTWRAWARASAPRMWTSTQLSPSIAHLSTRQPQNSTFSKSLLAESVFQRNISTSLKSDRVSKCLGRSLHLINHRASFYLCAEGLLTDKKIIKKFF